MKVGAQRPLERRIVQNHHMDSTVWDEFEFRAGDVVVATWAKSGSTWLQQIVGQVLLGPNPDLSVSELSCWLELRAAPRSDTVWKLREQAHRRFVKTHLPFDALPWSSEAKYIYIGRDGRDAVWSLFNHHHNVTDLAYKMLNESEGLVGPPLDRPAGDVLSYWHGWLAGDGYPFWPYWENIRSWWAVRDLPNVMLAHYNELKADPAGRMRDIAAFIGAEVDPADWPEILEYCSFDWMKANAERVTPEIGTVFKGGSAAFYHRGENGAWKDVLSDEDSAKYECKAVEELGEECARWLIHKTSAE